MKRTVQNGRGRLPAARLATAIAGALAIATASPAFASLDPVLGTTTVDVTGTGPLAGAWSQTGGATNYLHAVVGWQYLTQPVTSELDGSGVLVNGFTSGAPLTNSNEVVKAGTFDATSGLTGANAMANVMDLGLLGRDEVNEGLGILSGQLTNGGSARATVSGGYVTTSVSDYTSGNITQDSNAIGAAAVINNASNQVSGTATPGFAGSGTAAIGSSTDAQGASGEVTASGTVTIANNQAAVDANANGSVPPPPPPLPIGPLDFPVSDTASYAHVLDSGISVTDIAFDEAPAINLSLSDNTLSAAYGSNQASNGFSATSGTFAGSLAISNTQQNLDHLAIGGQDMSLVEDANISSDVVGQLDGTVSMSGNAIAASTQGNAATNQATFAQGVDVLGSAVNGKLSSNASNSGVQAQSVTGDVVIASTQANADTHFGSRVDDAGITSTVWGLGSGSSVALDGDAISSRAVGNTVNNGVSANGTTYTANTLVASQQTNTSASVMGSLEDSGIGIEAYDEGLGDSLGTTSLTNATLSGAATGNDAKTLVNVGATNMAVYNNTDQTYARSTNAWTDKAGFGVSNFQSNDGIAAITGVVANSGVEIDHEGDMSGALTLDDNGIAAGATGNNAVTGITTSGTNGSVGGQLANSQSNDASVSAIATESGVIADIYGTAIGTGATLDGNTVSSMATGNRASNLVSADFDHLTSGAYADSWSVASSVINPVNQYNTAEAPFAIASNQYNGGYVAAITDDGIIGAEIGDLSGSTVSASDNATSATAISNTVGNTLSLTAGDLKTASGTQDQVASVSSLQESDSIGGTQADVDVEGDDPRKVGQTGVFMDGNVDGSSLAISDNAVQAAAYTNMASNNLTLAGGTFAPAASETATGNIGYIASDSLTVSSSFALQNVQASEGAGALHEASVSNGNIGINLTQGASDDRHAVTDSTLAVADNAVTADVRDNYATNQIGLGVSYAADGTATADPMSVLDTTAGLQNAQMSDGILSGTVSGLVGMVAGHYDVTDSTLSYTGNTVSSTAIANTGFNSLDVAATQLGGDSNNLGLLPGPGVSDYSSVPVDIGVGIGADYGLSNVQLSGSSVTSMLSGTGVGMGVGEGSINGGSVAITGNDQTALALQNSASNALNLLGTDVSANAALSNQQTAAGTMTQATVTTDPDSGLASAMQVFGSLGASSATPVTVSGNALIAQAGGNDASNVLQATASGSLLGQAFGFAATGNAFGLTPQAYADYAVYSDQSTSGIVSASAQPGLMGVEVVGMDANGVSSTIGNAGSSSALSVSGNQIAAQATANNAANAVSLDGAAVTSASGAIVNRQDASGVVTASTSDGSIGVYNRDIGQAQGGTITNTAMTVSDNQVAATASGNVATNQLAVTSSALNGGTVVNDQATNDSAGLIAAAGYAVLNAQTNSAIASASVANTSIGVNADVGNLEARGSLAQLANSNVAVSGNSVLASAAGNTASSSIALPASLGSTPSASLVSSQINSASISATVSNVQIGAEAGLALARSNSPITVSGNTISASAVGNSATNHIGIGH